ncbi:hypothetical protein GCM10009765_19010 [Fodinicola feengrottensis]|uniref:Winged helix DNA-binding domain-containing protein n=1 Tax=Fodinicola feengrottensis TaxID=435914 RepID=A0ABN2GE04_9ACTN
MAHPTRLLQDLVHQRVRLGILVALAGSQRLGFTTLRDALGQPDSGLSRHLGVLEAAGLVGTRKVIEDNRSKTWVWLTDTGRQALRAELDGLQSMMAGLSDSMAAADEIAGSAEVFVELLGDWPPVGTPEGPSPDELVLVDPPAGFQLVRDLPIDEKYELAGVKDWGRAESQRLAFRSHGLRGGRLRQWGQRPSDADSGAGVIVSLLLIELGSEAAPPAIMGTFAPSTLPVPQVPDSRGYVLHLGGRFPFAGVCWFGHGCHLICVTAQANEPAIVRLLGAQTAAAQHRRLTELKAPGQERA